jgi:type IV fimbrial biogenesis protein FimT
MLKHQKAFTLIELLITIAIMAVLVAMAAPSFNRLIANNRSDATSEGFIAEISRARSEAIKRPTRVSMCASADGLTCGGTWANGIMTFIDGATSDTATTPTVTLINNAPISYWRPLEPKAVISVTSNNVAISFFRFTSLGTLAGGQTVVANTNTQGCKGDNLRVITLGLAGTVSSTKQSCP